MSEHSEGRTPGYFCSTRASNSGYLLLQGSGPGLQRLGKVCIAIWLLLLLDLLPSPSFTGVHPQKHPVSLTVSVSISREKLPHPAPSFSDCINLCQQELHFPKFPPVWFQDKVTHEGHLCKIWETEVKQQPLLLFEGWHRSRRCCSLPAVTDMRSACWHAAQGSSSSSATWARCICSFRMHMLIQGAPADPKVTHIMEIGGGKRQIQTSGCHCGFQVVLLLPHLHLFFSTAGPADHRRTPDRGSSLT